MFAKIFKRMTAALLCGAMLLSLVACQEDPEGNIVVHKDMDKLISQAARPAESGGESGQSRVEAADIVEEVKQVESYQTEIDNEGLNVKVSVNAQVEVPEVDQLSVYRVAQRKFDQELIDRVRAQLVGDRQLYSSAVIYARTRKSIEQEIAFEREQMAIAEEQYRAYCADMGEEVTEKGLKQARAEHQQDIDELEEAYKTAPEKITFAGYENDGKLRPAESDLNPDGDMLSVVTDGSDGSYQVFYVQNDADHSNKLVWRSSPEAYAHTDGVIVGKTPLVDPYYSKEDLEYFRLPDNFLSSGIGLSPQVKLQTVAGDSVSITRQEAQAQADALLEKLGITDFSLADGGEFLEYVLPTGREQADSYEENTLPVRDYYILQYVRVLDGVPFTQSSGGKLNEDNAYRKQSWPGECIEVRVNDSGIVGLDIYAPVEITETVVENAALKSFSDVKGTFEKMVGIVNADEDTSSVVTVDNVRLSYSRISEADSFDTGLIVPVWSFEGKREIYYEEGYLGQTIYGTVLAINAIDGSVIDAAQGY